MPKEPAGQHLLDMMQNSLSCRDHTLLRFVRDDAPCAVLVLDNAGSVVEMNRAARDGSVDFAALFDPAHIEDLVWSFLERLEQPGARTTLEISCSAGDGSMRRVVLDGSNVYGWRVVAAHDVTEVRALEHELRDLRRIESLGLLTASLAHDLNNLLTPVLCLSGVLSRTLADGPAAALVAELESSADRAAALLRDLRALARQRPLAVQAIDVNEVVTDLRSIARRIVGDAIELTVVCDPSAGTPMVDRAHLERALVNLVTNARDALSAGGRVEIRTARIDPDPGHGSVLPYVAITVTDNGRGMSEDVRTRVLERVFTTKEAVTGLGLASVHRFVREHAGTISIESEPGRGTTVALRLPCIGFATAIAEPPPPLRAGHETVLVVDSDAAVRNAMRAVLEAHGHRVLEASTAEDALEMAQSGERIHVAIVEASIVEPELLHPFGLALRSARVVWMSARSIESGVALAKPFSERDLVRAVGAALDRR